ncbi:MAG: hypothetical protein JW754_00330 [Candidatus Aenigmarchaeota archaeon]|nr:hypothetical protein [Candidatus Aenigmarchaeota archaeon]
MKHEKIRITGLFFVFLTCVSLIAVSGCVTPGGGTVDMETFARCLTENGAVMYGSQSCGFCAKQKEMFGENFVYVNYVDCGMNMNSCVSEGIRGYPTWKVKGNAYEGLQELATLGGVTGCGIPVTNESSY